MSEHLSNSPEKPLPAHSHKHTLVWKWLDDTKSGDGEAGAIIRQLRQRRDMPRSFPHRAKLIEYLLKCKINTAMVGRNAQFLYSQYNDWVQQQKHNPDDGTSVKSVPPSIAARSGITRKQLATVILGGFTSCSDPAQNLQEGGRLAESAYHAADAVLGLFLSRTNGQTPPAPDVPDGSGFLSR